MDRQTGKTQGYGFIQFKSPEHTSRAIASLNGMPVSGKRLKVTLAKPREEAKLNTNIYVSGLPPDPYCTDVYLHGLCSAHGTVLELKLLREAAIRGSHQTLSAFVRFRRRHESDNAIAKLNGAVVQPPGTNLTWMLSARYATDARTRSKESAGVWISDSLGTAGKQNGERSSQRRTNSDDRTKSRNHSHNNSNNNNSNSNNFTRDGGRKSHIRPVNPWHTPPTIGHVEIGKVKDTVSKVTIEEPDFVTPLKPTRLRNGENSVSTIKSRVHQNSTSYHERDASTATSGGPPSVISAFSHHSLTSHPLSSADVSPNSSAWSIPGSQPTNRWNSAVSPSDTGFYPTQAAQRIPMAYPPEAPYHPSYSVYQPRQFQDYPLQHASQTYSPEFDRHLQQSLPPHSTFHPPSGAYYPPYPAEGQQQFVPFADMDYASSGGSFRPDASSTSRHHYSSFVTSPPVSDGISRQGQTPGLPTQSVSFPVSGSTTFQTNPYLDQDRASFWDSRFSDGAYNPDWSTDTVGAANFGPFASQKLHTPTLDNMKVANSRREDASDLDNAFDLDALLNELPINSEDINSPRSNKLGLPKHAEFSWNTNI